MEKKLFLFVFSLLCAGIVNAAILNVPAEYSTIQTGIDSSSVGDTVLVQPGTYVENINYNGKNIVVGSLFLISQDTSYISQTVIDGNQNGSVVKFESGEDSTAVLCGFTITNGFASGGGGIYCHFSSPRLADITITENSASWYGGGICCEKGSTPRLANVSISNNSAYYGGGISSESYSSLIFDSDKLCNIYSNSACQGNDLYSGQLINVIVDTFTVMNPTNFHAFPIENFTFDILNSVQIQIYSDLYVAPDGNNANSGLSWDDPLRTIAFALSIIQADSLNPYTIHLASGIYCPNTNGEQFPVLCNSYVSIKGDVESETILDANNEYFLGGVIYSKNVHDVTIEGMTITNGLATFGGGIYCYNSSLYLLNITISDNSATFGGGIHCRSNSNPSLKNVTICGNSANYFGSGIFCQENSSPSLENVTVFDNSADCGGGIYCCYNSNPSMTNVTISDNSANYIGGGGISCRYSSNPSLVNSILWNNFPQEIYFWEDCDPNSITIAYSDVQGGEAGIVTNNNGTVNWLDGNIDADPLFADPQNGDFHLTWTNFPIPDSTMSPCIDTGDPNSPLDPDSTRADMGAYYFNQNVSVDDPQDISDCSIWNYPNPIKNSTTILYSLKKNSHVMINIYNIKGQLISTLIDATKPKGEHFVIFDAEALSSGVYFYKMQTEDRSEIRKMIVIK